MENEKNAPAGQGSTSAIEIGNGKGKEISRGFIYKDDFLCLNYLSTEQKGKLLEAIYEFMFLGKESMITDNTDNIVCVAFAPIRQHILRDRIAYLEKCETNRINSKSRKICHNSSQASTKDSMLMFHEPSREIDSRWINQEVAGVLITASELHDANNLFFWENYPADQLKACYDYYGRRKEGWGQWTTQSARWNNAICQWTNRTGKERFAADILMLIGDVYDIAPDEVKNCITRADFNIAIQSDNSVHFIYGANLQIGKWLQENREAIEKITAIYGYGEIHGDAINKR